MKLSQIIGIAKAFLPANSPWLERIDQAAQMAKSFSPDKDGIAQLMARYGKDRSDLRKAVGMLENPAVKNALSRVPGLSNLLNNAANELMKDSNIGGTDKQVSTTANSGNSFEALQARLDRLK